MFWARERIPTYDLKKPVIKKKIKSDYIEMKNFIGRTLSRGTVKRVRAIKERQN